MFTLYRITFSNRHDKVGRYSTNLHTYPMCDSPLSLEIGAAQIRFVTEIAPKSPFLCVKRNTIRYRFRFGARATILDKTVEKIAFLEVIFFKLCSRPILPFPSTPGSSVVGSSKESRIPKHL